MGVLVRLHLPHANRFTAHRTLYIAHFGATKGMGGGRGEAEDRPRAETVEFAATKSVGTDIA
jgi:hypothetical protein